MLDRRGVDEPPVHRVALWQRDLLVVRPRLAVEHEHALERPVGIAVEPLRDHPDAVARRRRPDGIDDECAAQLGVEPVALRKPGEALQDSPVGERAGRVEPRDDLARRAGREVHGVVGGLQRRTEAAEHDRRVGAIAQREPQRRTGGSAQQRTRDLWRPAGLGEGEHTHHGVRRALRPSRRLDDVERDGQRALRQAPRGGQVLVDRRHLRARQGAGQGKPRRRRNDGVLEHGECGEERRMEGERHRPIPGGGSAQSCPPRPGCQRRRE